MRLRHGALGRVLAAIRGLQVVEIEMITSGQPAAADRAVAVALAAFEFADAGPVWVSVADMLRALAFASELKQATPTTDQDVRKAADELAQGLKLAVAVVPCERVEVAA